MFPTCPKCESVMIERTVKQGKNAGKKFLGCSNYPRCDGMIWNIPYKKQEVKPVALSSSFVANYQQENIKTRVLSKHGHVLVNAVPGSGKTTTAVWVMGFTNPNEKILVMAFNTSIKEELKAKLAHLNHVRVESYHSLGLSIIRSVNPRVRIDDSGNKYFDILANWGMMAEDDIKVMHSPLIKTRNMLCANLLDITPENIEAVNLAYNIEYPEDKNYDLVACLNYLHRKGLENLQSITFDDMVYLPRFLNVKFPVFDRVVIDECQDTSPNDLNTIEKLNASSCLFVGDDWQAINGFRGASSQAIKAIIDKFNPDILPLTITQRCKSKISTWATENIYSLTGERIELIARHEGGEVLTIEEDNFLTHLTETNKALIVCRYNAPLVKPALSLMKQGKRAVIKGKDIGKDIINLIVKQKCEELGDLIPALESYYGKQCAKYEKARDKSFLDVLADKIDVIKALTEDVFSISELTKKIGYLFSDNETGFDFIFSSIHKAKGLEHESVYCLKYNTWISKRAVTDEQKKQEYNAVWVGTTRAKNLMVLIPDNTKK